MSTPPLPAPQPVSLLRRFHFQRARLIFLGVLVAIFALCMVFIWTTRDAMVHLPFLSVQGQRISTSNVRKSVVDIGPWETAEALAPLAVTSEESTYANEAQRLADHEVDQAFTFALRQPPSIQSSTQSSPQPSAQGKPSSEAQDLAQKVAQLNQQIKDDQAQIKLLTPNGVQPAPNSTEADNLDILKAQLSLDGDVLNDAQDQLARATGDQRPQIQQELTAHEAAMAKLDAKAKRGEVAVISLQRYSTLAGRIEAWLAQNSRYQLIQQAKDEAWADTASLEADYNRLEAQAGKSSRDNAQANAAQDHATRLAALKQQGQLQQLIGICNDRIHTQKQLANLYDKWAIQVQLQHRIVLHLILQSIAMIAFILICVTLFTSIIHRWMERPGLDPRRTQTLRTIFQLSVQILGIVMIMFVVFGVPKQVSTVIGLATAGLTVALQDFIIAFLGWFVLMGKNGIRLGDSVEINGVTGEVIELGLFRTAILETGNSTEEGHPTGRRVAILNKFAVNGQYFNFSTASQWMWDEISVNVPESENSYTIIEQIHKAILKETDQDAHKAEQEWKRSSRLNGLTQFGGSAQVNLRPASPGINVLVRYVTRAADRFDRRNLLYQTVIDVLHKQAGIVPAK
ncbi:mechanosensitive ion channel family protein [Acidicapsa ligni]|uniref:mechanosensitive ion channel family protein n=1 Tax=Acidicapsa ligni TaxID=542300 RepID=UPI0021E0F700|nr:mechanosensitive ion channel domain-containing protein [Acidicapsa ligni]